MSLYLSNLFIVSLGFKKHQKVPFVKKLEPTNLRGIYVLTK